MKLLVLGDTHGRRTWEAILAQENYDRCVFIGDYFDAHDETDGEEQMANFRKLLNLKQSEADKIVLLLGNHDYHYLPYTSQQYSGFQEKYSRQIRELLLPAVEEELVQLAFGYEEFLFSHAGISKTWCRNNGINTTQLPEAVNRAFQEKPSVFGFSPGPERNPFGDEVSQSPLWIRPNSLLQDLPEGYTQVVGHTVRYKLELSDELILIDTLGTTKEYLVIESGQLRVGKPSL